MSETAPPAPEQDPADLVAASIAGPSPAAPLVRPSAGVRLLATVVMAILVGALGGGAAAWAIYQHYGPVERIYNQQVSGAPGGQSQTVGQLAQANAAAVVTIATQPVTPGDLANGSASLVNGVVVSSTGLILTSTHAVDGASQLRVGLPDGQGYEATVIKQDIAHGLALLSISGVSGLAAIPLSTAAPAVGDEAIALSRPASGGLSVGVGTISSVGETVITDTIDGPTSVQGAISIDATSEPGADGAPVLSSAGNLIGVVTLTQAGSPPGLTALSLSAASALLASATATTSQPQGSFGVQSTYLDPAIAAAADLTQGALIDAVDAGGPAAGTGGLQVGDIVTSVNAVSINATHPFDPTSLGLSPGDTAELTVVRGSTTLTVAITVGKAS
jgi:serine protease Do